MNYYQAREKLGEDGKGNGRWCWTVKNDNLIYTAECCAGHAEQGHASKEEAEECHHQWQLRRYKIQGPKTAKWPKEKCAVKDCQEEALYLASAPGMCPDYQLCPDCAKHEILATLIPKCTNITSSY